MTEVTASYKCLPQTFFKSVQLLDQYYKSTTVVHELNDLHLIGISCMFIASKLEEIYPIKIKTVFEKIAH